MKGGYLQTGRPHFWLAFSAILILSILAFSFASASLLQPQPVQEPMPAVEVPQPVQAVQPEPVLQPAVPVQQISPQRADGNGQVQEPEKATVVAPEPARQPEPVKQTGGKIERIREPSPVVKKTEPVEAVKELPPVQKVEPAKAVEKLPEPEKVQPRVEVVKEPKEVQPALKTAREPQPVQPPAKAVKEPAQLQPLIALVSLVDGVANGLVALVRGLFPLQTVLDLNASDSNQSGPSVWRKAVTRQEDMIFPMNGLNTGISSILIAEQKLGGATFFSLKMHDDGAYFSETCDAGHLRNWSGGGPFEDSTGKFVYVGTGWGSATYHWSYDSMGLDFNVKMTPAGGGGANSNLMMYFMSSTSDPNNTNGYYIVASIGQTFRLAKKTGSQVSDLITSSVEAVAGRERAIQVTRNSSGRFELFIDGVSQGTAVDSEYTHGEYFIIRSDAKGAAIDDITLETKSSTNSDPVITISANQTKYMPGQMLEIYVDIANEGDPRTVDEYIMLDDDPTTSTNYYWFNRQYFTKHFHKFSGTVPSEFSEHFTIMRYEIPDSLPKQEYELLAAFTAPGTGDIIGEISSFKLTVSEGNGNTPPTASFTVDRESGPVGTLFSFDASGSTDAEDPTSELQVRWDWEDDGQWDTGYTTTKTASHSYPTTGTKTIRLEVMDTGSLTNQATRNVNVTEGNEPSCGDVVIHADDVTLDEGETVYREFYYENHSDEAFYVGDVDAGRTSSGCPFDADETGNYDSTINAGGQGKYELKITGHEVDEDKRGSAYVKVRGHFSGGKGCSYDEIGEKRFTVYVNDSGSENHAPVIESINDSPDPVEAGETITFEVYWHDSETRGTQKVVEVGKTGQNDLIGGGIGGAIGRLVSGFADAVLNPSKPAPEKAVPLAGNDSTKTFICKTNSHNGTGCSSGNWCQTGYSDSSPGKCTYETQESDSGTNDYYAFVCDDEGLCSSSESGTSTVRGGGEELTISISPEDLTVESDQKVRFTANASGGTGSYSYEWTISPSTDCQTTGESTREFLVQCTNSGSAQITKTITVTVESSSQSESKSTNLYVNPHPSGEYCNNSNWGPSDWTNPSIWWVNSGDFEGLMERYDGFFKAKADFKWDSAKLANLKNKNADRLVFEFRRDQSRSDETWDGIGRGNLVCFDYWAYSDLPNYNVSGMEESDAAWVLCADDYDLLCAAKIIIGGICDEEYQIVTKEFAQLQPNETYTVQWQLFVDKSDGSQSTPWEASIELGYLTYEEECYLQRGDSWSVNTKSGAKAGADNGRTQENPPSATKAGETEIIDQKYEFDSKEELLSFREKRNTESSEILGISDKSIFNGVITFNKRISKQELKSIIDKFGLVQQAVRYRSTRGGGHAPYYYLDSAQEYIDEEHIAEDQLKNNGIADFKLIEGIAALRADIPRESIVEMQKEQMIFLVDIGPKEKYIKPNAIVPINDVGYYVETYLE